ncbi:sel1 repeat family protein [Pararhizobium mangrovi]|uniref:Sel1 repeat family protein n=1 Tax=Pararhizobium mangrovi TaxID=2590452 RepID=A0A506U8N9_9HYPH|nr:sel1 repeat family protein [Pararhizobium mangrovi]TPW29868.1 sel1 repeat family protein [Pararhizobium mangrovi]
MARFELFDENRAMIGGKAEADALCEMGLCYATGRSVAVDLVAAHKWFNIAAVKGSDRASELRTDIAAMMTKSDLARALRAAREWMTVH